MANRISKYFDGGHKKRPQNVQDTRTFFLACEFKPGGEFWNVIESFAYDVKPAFIYGSLGVMAYDPASYAIVENNEQCQPLLGFLVTITHPETIKLLDRVKGYLGLNLFNTHIRKLVKAYTDVNKEVNAWCYLISNNVLNSFQTIETVEFGMWDDDPKQLALLERIIDKG